MRDSSFRPAPHRVTDALVLVVAAAMIACWGHLGVVAAMRHVFGVFSWKWWLRDQVLLTSAGYLLVVGSLSALPAALHVLWPRRATFALLTAFVGGIVAFAILLLFQRISPWALATLALGCAVQLHALARKREGLLRRASRMLAVAGVLASVLVASSTKLLRARGESRALASLAAVPEGTPNVLLIILDTVRASSMGMFGGPYDNTPRLAEWGRRGVVFDRAFSASSWTLPSHASMFTGAYASIAGADWKVPLGEACVTLAEVMRAHGLVTGGFAANSVAAWYRTGLAQGFLHYEDTKYSLAEYALSTTLTQTRSVVNAYYEWEKSHWLRGAVKGALPLSLVAHGNYVAHDFIPAGEIADGFLRWQGGLEGRPFFAFLNFFDAHAPYVPPTPYRTMYGKEGLDIDRYHGAIRYMDAEVDRVLRTLERRGVLRNTIVIITSDHGELFGEHGLVGHGNGLYLDQLHVPLVILNAPGVPAGQRIGELVSLRDLAATIVDLALGTRDRALGGTSLRPVMTGEVGSAVSPVIAEVNKGINVSPATLAGRADQKSVVTDTVHVIQSNVNTLGVYAHARDPREEHDLSADPAARAGALALMQQVLDAHGIRWRAPE